MNATDQCAHFYILLEAHTSSQCIIVILITTKRYLVRAEPLLYHLDSANHFTSFGGTQLLWSEVYLTPQ